MAAWDHRSRVGTRRVDRLVLMLVDYEPPKPLRAKIEADRSLSNGVQQNEHSQNDTASRCHVTFTVA